MLIKQNTYILSGYKIRSAHRIVKSYSIYFSLAMVTELNKREPKCEKLCSFENWPQWADLTQVILEKKEVWDVVNGIKAEPTTVVQTRKQEKDNAVISKII